MTGHGEKARHTAGPWEAKLTPLIGGKTFVWQIMTQDWPAQLIASTVRKKADACAIAALPDVIDALRDLIPAVEAEINEKGGGGFVLARLTDARNALAKADGRP